MYACSYFFPRRRRQVNGTKIYLYEQTFYRISGEQPRTFRDFDPFER